VFMVAVVFPWHSVQLLVPPPSCVFQVYGESAVVFCPLLWQAFVPQLPWVLGHAPP